MCTKLWADSKFYKLPFVTVKQVSVPTVPKRCSSLAKDLYLKKKIKTNQYFIFVSSTLYVWMLADEQKPCSLLLLTQQGSK